MWIQSWSYLVWKSIPWFHLPLHRNVPTDIDLQRRKENMHSNCVVKPKIETEMRSFVVLSQTYRHTALKVNLRCKKLQNYILYHLLCRRITQLSAVFNISLKKLHSHIKYTQYFIMRALFTYTSHRLWSFRFSSGSGSVCMRRISIVRGTKVVIHNNRNHARAYTYTSTWKSKTPDSLHGDVMYHPPPPHQSPFMLSILPFLNLSCAIS